MKSVKFFLLVTAATGLFFSVSAHAATGSGNWAVNKISAVTNGGTANGYCTISQNFSGAGVVTLGQTSQNQYSMAFDIASKIFTAGKAQTISLKTTKKAAQNFQITPQSATVAVLNLGGNKDVWQSFHAGDELTLTASGKDYTFAPSQTGKAQKDLMDCLTALKTPVKSIAPTTPQAPTSAITNNELAVREENAKLKQALQQTEQQLQQSQAGGASSSKLVEMADKVRMLELENAQLKASGAAIRAGTSPALAQTKAELNVLAEQKLELEKQLQVARNAPAKSSGNEAQLASLSKENTDLKTKLDTINRQIVANDKSGDVKRAMAERDALKQQLTQANAQLVELQKRTMELAAQQPTPRVNDAALQKRLAELQTENGNLKLQMASNTKTPTVTINPNMKLELDKLQTQVNDLQSQNAQLSAALTQRQIQNNSVSTTGVAQNFDLVQATKRYEEATREIRRLGAIIQMQEAKNTAEKRDIEGMLFDPAIASSAQVVMKQSYEQRIYDLENQLQAKGVTPVQAVVSPVTASPRMATGYGASRSSPNEPPPLSGMIPTISEAEVSRDMMPLPMPAMAAVQQPIIQPIIQQVPVERIIERVVEKSDPRKDAELAKISQELQFLKANQDKQAQENAQLRNELVQKQKAKEEAETLALAATKQAEESKKAQQKIQQAAVQTPLAATVKPVAVTALAPITPAPVARPNFITARDMTNMLKQGGVSLTQSVSDMGGGSDTYQAYSWKVGNLFGSAEQRVTGSASDYQTAIASYMDRARARCKGDFAAEPSAMSSSAPNATGYEIACIGGKVDTSASVLFSYSDRIMTTIAHEGKSDLMGEAMNARDNLARNWSSAVTASR